MLVLVDCGKGYCITTAFYEDGTVSQYESLWQWEDVNRVIDALPEADPQEMARQLWRDAKKDPPAPMVDVIAYCADGSILTAFRYESGDWAENRENLMLDDVTHWMPNITGPELEESEA